MIEISEASRGTLFLGGIRNGEILDVCPWQRVVYILEGKVPTARYVRRQLAFDNHPGVRVFVWDQLDTLKGVKTLVAAYVTRGLN
jgi:hypothetical protein